MRKRRNKQEQHVDTHRWIVSYADFITLLFAFFVVMYAISSVNVSKYKAMSDGMHSAFTKKPSQERAADYSSGKTPEDDGSARRKDQADPFNSLDDGLSTLQDENFLINKEDGFIEFNIKAGSLFDSGSADLKPQAAAKMIQLAKLLKDQPYPIALEGYTDNEPISTSQFPSNWELSAARASALARALSDNGISSKMITVTGYGEQYPVADNNTEEGRSRNRRVNIIIARDRSVARLWNPELSAQTSLGESVIPPIYPVKPIYPNASEQRPLK